MKVLQIFGDKKVGKTTVMLDFIKFAKELNFNVVCAKNAHEAVMDTPQTDSYRFAEAGADAVLLQTGQEFLWHEKSVESLEDIIEQYAKPDTDLLLIEGYRNSELSCSKIELIGPNTHERILEGERGFFHSHSDFDGQMHLEIVTERIVTIYPDFVSEDVQDFTTVEKRRASFKAWIEAESV